MNIRDGHSSSYWTNSTVYSHPVAARPSYIWDVTSSVFRPQPTSPPGGSSTYEHVKGPPGTKAWSVTAFVVTALSLAIGGVLLPLVAGHLFRVVLRFTYRNRIWGRVLMAPLPLGYVLPV